ncbi:MAG: PASTA domain-containing protein [Lawsonibacter sp.]|nr:PASTA domain-containing protein [Lawsonibacter sp.]
MRSRYERGSGGRGSVQSTATRGTHSKRSIFLRTVFLMVLCGVVMFIPLAWKLWDIAILHHEEYQERASDQQSLKLEVPASRGDIYDRNGNTLAMSATVYELIVSPKDLEKSVKAEDYKDAEGNLDPDARAAAVEAKRNQLIDGLMELVPGLDRENLDQRFRKTKSAYENIKKNIEEEEAKVIRQYIVDNKAASYMYLITSSRRYYPYSSLAAQVLGFVNANGGAVGIEAQYDDLLEGTAGRVVTTKTAAGTAMYNSYSLYIDAEDGYDLTLTLDTTIQSYAEKALERGIKAYDVRNGAFCLVMDPNTGAVLAMASSPDFDPNNYSKITNEILNRDMEENTAAIYERLLANNTENLTSEELMDKAKAQAYSDAVNTQWRSKVLDSRYEPGSTFKALVLAAALEEGLVSENDSFTCTGSVMVPGYDDPINCSKRSPGHGNQSLAKAVQNSCNPAFIEIGKRMGIDTFYDYLEAFGLTERTGIDLPGEASTTGAIWPRASMTNVDLAVGSFGQRLEVTPLQMIASFAAVINGGNLLQPYVVQSVTAKDGTVIQNTEPTVVRQVVSKETSQRAVDILESVVSEGTGGNAYMAGYRIGGKTGSSQTRETGRTIVSFMGFAPADDPQVIVLLAYDKPQEKPGDPHHCTTGVYISGGNMAAKQAGPLIAEILDYLGVEKQYSAGESAAVDVFTPRVTGQALSNAEDILRDKDLRYRTVGSGETVTSQIPAAGASVPSGSTVILYLGDAVPDATNTVPDVTGQSYESAKNRLENAGFFMRASGVSTYYSNTTTAEYQSVAGGETAAIGTVIDVRFYNMIDDGQVN